MHEKLHERAIGLALPHDHGDFALETRDVFNLVVDVEEIHGDDIAFDAACRSRAGPTHGIHVKLVARGRKQFGLGGAARPASPDRVFFEVHVLEAHGLHLGDTPFLGLMVAGRAGDARTDVVGQFP